MLGELLNWLRELVFMVSHVSGASFPEKMSAEAERDALARLEKGDPAARNELVEGNLRFVAHIARRFTNTGMDLDDLVSVGTIGLIKAVNTFKPARGVQLATYSARCIENEILMCLRTARNKQRDAYLFDSIGNDSEGNEITLSDILGTSPTEVSDDVERRVEAEKLNNAMKESLTPQEARVLRMRYGLGLEDCHPQRVIGDTLGISRSYVSRIEKKALEKLAAKMKV